VKRPMSMLTSNVARARRAIRRLNSTHAISGAVFFQANYLLN
jgi:hypothetical protein